MRRVGECSFLIRLQIFAHFLIHSCSPQVAVSLAQGGALSLVRAIGSLSQTFSSPELIESITEAVAAMSRFPDLQQGLIVEGGALSCLAPLCVEDVGTQRQEASLGVHSLSKVDGDIAHFCSTGTLALLCSCSGTIECSVNTALQVTLARARRRFCFLWLTLFSACSTLLLPLHLPMTL